MSPLSCAGGICGGLGATCQTDNGAQLSGYSAEDCVSVSRPASPTSVLLELNRNLCRLPTLQGYCLYGECSPGYPVGHTCTSSNDCALPVGAASGSQPLQCSSGTCGGYGDYCPVNTPTTTSWCSSGLACVNYQCALAASGTARKRKRLQQQMQKSLSRTWQQQQLDSTESCGDGSIRCPTGGAAGAFEVGQSTLVLIHLSVLIPRPPALLAVHSRRPEPRIMRWLPGLGRHRLFCTGECRTSEIRCGTLPHW